RAPNSLMWKDFWGEGARKTVIKRLAKYLPLSAEDRRAIDRDETEFEAQRRDALLDKAREQIGAQPVAAIEHTTDDAQDQPAEDTVTVDGEIVDDDPARTVAEGDAEEKRVAEERDASRLAADELIGVLSSIREKVRLAEFKTEQSERLKSLLQEDL